MYTSTYAYYTTLHTPPAIHLEIDTRDEPGLCTRHEYTRTDDILHLADAAHGHIGRELFPVCRRILHAREGREEPRARDERTDGVDADLVGAVLGREALGRLDGRMSAVFLSFFRSFVRPSIYPSIQRTNSPTKQQRGGGEGDTAKTYIPHSAL
jgi:hypothetical protein